jgi:hypothetical protein
MSACGAKRTFHQEGSCYSNNRHLKLSDQLNNSVAHREYEGTRPPKFVMQRGANTFQIRASHASFEIDVTDINP